MFNTLSTTRLLLQRWLFPLFIILLCLIIALAGSEFSSALQYERNEIFGGQLYRLLSGHLVHIGWAHLGVNLLGFIVVWLLFFLHDTWKYAVLIFVICSMGTSLGLLLFNAEIIWYSGLSGALHGLFVIGVMRTVNIRQYSDLILPGLIIIKLTWEQLSGPMPGSEFLSQGNVIIDAHLYGSITGLFFGLAYTKLNPS